MAGFVLLIAVLLAGLSYTSFTARSASAHFYGPNWATKLCSSASGLCEYPYEVAYAAAGLVALWLLMKFVSAVKD